jgi:hypothetical protein
VTYLTSVTQAFPQKLSKEIRNLKKAKKEQRKRGLRERQLPDKGDEELLRASKKQKREARKIEIEQEREAKAHDAELNRLQKATARKSLPVHQRDIERCLDILPQTWKKAARRNVIKRVQEQMSTIWPIYGEN